MKLIAVLVGGMTVGTMLGADDPARSAWVYPGADGHLNYKITATGDRIVDFSSAGYRGGGVAFPSVPVVQTVQPTGGADDAPAIQAAIAAVAARPLVDGFRGAVLLGPGVFTCSRSIVLDSGGIVLRGSASTGDARATTIKMTGGRHAAIWLGSRTRPPPPTIEIRTAMADPYVPAGANKFAVVDASGLAAGDSILIVRPTTPAWVKFMGMDDLVRTGRQQSWLGQGPSGTTRRTIIGISDRVITCDLPLTDSYDARYLNPPGTAVVKVVPPLALTNIGVEHLHIQCPPRPLPFGKAPYSALQIVADDCWVKDVFCDETMNSTVLEGNRLTLEQVVVKHTYPNLGAAKPSDFSILGSQILIDRCEVTGDNEYFVWTLGHERGPNVVLNSVFRGRGSRIQPHMHWSTGLLIDNCTVPDGGIDFMNRGEAGSGHGWGMGWAVAWNCVASTYLIQSPPGSVNWSIGCIGTRTRQPRMFAAAPILPEGTVDSPGQPVTPQSLYLAQLADRLGPQAVTAIGYPANASKFFAGKTTPRLPPYPADVDPELGPNLASHRAVDTSSIRGGTPEFGGEKALDEDEHGYWATENRAVPATLDLDMEGPVEMNTLVLAEAPGADHRILRYKVEGMSDSNWEVLTQGTTIGERQVAHFPTRKIWKVRLTVLEVEGYAALRKLGLYLAPTSPEKDR